MRCCRARQTAADAELQADLRMLLQGQVRVKATAMALGTFAALLLTSGPAWSESESYETPAVVSAADILPAELLKGDFHEVDDAVRSDGYLNYYTIRSDYGDFEAVSTVTLRIRLREVAALTELDEVSKTEVFIKAAADAGVGQLRTIKQFATHPVESVVGIPKGIGRMFTRYERRAGDAAEAAKDFVTTEDEEAATGSDVEKENSNVAAKMAQKYFGISAAERAWAQKLGTDPYTTNETLREAIKSVAWAERLGRFGAKLAPIPSIPGVDIIDTVNDVVWSKDPYELQDLNRERLQTTGADEETIDKYLGNPWLSPTQQTLLTAAIAELEDVDGRARILRQSLNTQSETEARFFVRSVVLLAWYHRNEQPIVSVTTELVVPAGVRSDGTTVAMFAVDHLYWTESIAQAAENYSQVSGEVPNQMHEVWILGTVSERCRRELISLGWDIQENLAAKLTEVPPFEIQGHRGAKGLAPENSIAAFEKAIALGVDTLEMDAQSTSDRVLVVYHDQKIDGARCRGSASKLLKDLTLEEVKAIRCEEGAAIPTLEEVLRLAHAAPYPVRANVEIKMQSHSRGIPVGEFVALLVDVIDATGMRGRVLVQSFDTEALRSMRRIAPDIPRAVLARNRGSYLAMVEDTTASVLLPRRDRLQREDVEALHARGVAVIPWVVDDPEEMRRLRSWGVDGIITNRPDVAIEFRDGPARGSTDRDTTPPPPTSWPPSPHAPTPSSAPPAQKTAYSLDNVHKIAVTPFTSSDVVDSFATSLFTQEFSGKHTRYELVDPVQLEMHV